MVVILDDELRKQIEYDICMIDEDIKRSSDKAEVMDLIQEKTILEDELRELENDN